jgi:hypothetical protein
VIPKVGTRERISPMLGDATQTALSRYRPSSGPEFADQAWRRAEARMDEG